MISLKSEAQILRARQVCSLLETYVDGTICKLADGSISNGLAVEQDFLRYFDLLKATIPGEWSLPFTEQARSNGVIYGHPLCISVNDSIVHAYPTDTPFISGDVITIDAGLYYDGMHADMARTVIYDASEHASYTTLLLVEACYEALGAGIEACKPGNKLIDISSAIANIGRKNKFGIVTDYMGHGIGKNLHEEPLVSNVPGLLLRYDDIVLRPGMMLCLEPMFTLGSGKTVLAPNGWEVWTQDGSLAAHFEDQVLITESGCEVLTNSGGK